jgi:hypothetical protein
VIEHGMRSHLLWCPVNKVELALLSKHSNSAMQEAWKNGRIGHKTRLWQKKSKVLVAVPSKILV